MSSFAHSLKGKARSVSAWLWAGWRDRSCPCTHSPEMYPHTPLTRLHTKDILYLQAERFWWLRGAGNKGRDTVPPHTVWGG